MASDRVVAYAARTGSPLPERIPVIVQRMVAAEVAGVLVTRDPLSGERVTVIEASWGLGPSVVDGAVVPDTVRVAADGIVSTRSARRPSGSTSRRVGRRGRPSPTTSAAAPASLTRSAAP